MKIDSECPERVPAEARPSWLYFLQQGTKGPIKIGYTNDVARRVNSLQMGNPARLRVRAAVVVEDAPDAEKFLKGLFKESHVRGEWFRPSWTVKRFIELLLVSARRVDRENLARLTAQPAATHRESR